MNDLNQLVSIIIPTFNSESTLAETLNSVLAQTFANIEILIIDGLSTDGTVRLAKQYNDDRIIVVSEKDAGIYDAMNKGIRIAKGDWLYFLGSDDTLYTNDTLHDIFSVIDLKQVDLIYGRVLFKERKIIFGEELTYMEMLSTQSNIPHQAIFYRKTLFDKIGFYNVKYPIYADFDFNVRCLGDAAVKPHFIDTIVAVYNELGASMNGRLKDNFYEDLIAFYVTNHEEPIALFKKYKKLLEDMEGLANENRLLKRSLAYKTGRIAAYPFKLVKNLLRSSAKNG